MKRKHALIVLFALIMTSVLTSLGSYQATGRRVADDMNRALALTLAEQQTNVISQDTIRVFNSHLQIAELRGKATLAVDTRSPQFKAYARCSEATIFSLSDQRPAARLWAATVLWALFVWHRRERIVQAITGTTYGGLTYQESDGLFYAEDGSRVQLTPMQQRLMEMFFRAPAHALQKSDICDSLWPKKPDASETLYTLIRRLKPVVEQHSQLHIASDRGKAYRLEIKQIED